MSANSNLQSIFPECHHHSPLPQSTAERAGLHVVVVCEIAAVDMTELSDAHCALRVMVHTLCLLSSPGTSSSPAHMDYMIYQSPEMKPVTHYTPYPPFEWSS